MQVVLEQAFVQMKIFISRLCCECEIDRPAAFLHAVPSATDGLRAAGKESSSGLHA
jgi:hypothetical protein